MIVREFLWQCSLLTVQFVQDSFVRELFYLDKYFWFCIDDYSRSHIHYMHLEIIMIYTNVSLMAQIRMLWLKQRMNDREICKALMISRATL